MPFPQTAFGINHAFPHPVEVHQKSLVFGVMNVLQFDIEIFNPGLRRNKRWLEVHAPISGICFKGIWGEHPID